MGKVKKLKPNTEEEESRTKEKKLNSNENQSYSSGSPSSDSPFSSSDSSDEEYQRKRKRKSKKSKKRSRLNCTLITETISTIENKIGICPECRGLDDEGPMIGCDSCDTWYHMACCNITVEPKDDESWFCKRCKEAEAKKKE